MLFLLYKVGILKETPKIEVGSMVAPYTKLTELKIRFFTAILNERLAPRSICPNIMD